MKSLAITLLIILVATATLGRDAAPIKSDPALPAADKALDCVVGHPDDGAYAAEVLVYPSISTKLAYLFNPMTEGCSCAESFVISAVHLLLEFEMNGSTSYQFQGALWSAVVDDISGCLAPGEELYTGPVVTISGPLDAPYHDFELPIDMASDCLTSSESYFLVFTSLDVQFQVWYMPLDATPQTCTNYSAGFSGTWIDRVAGGSYSGDMYMWGDAECCWNAVPDERRSWGALKSLFR